MVTLTSMTCDFLIRRVRGTWQPMQCFQVWRPQGNPPFTTFWSISDLSFLALWRSKTSWPRRAWRIYLPLGTCELSTPFNFYARQLLYGFPAEGRPCVNVHALIRRVVSSYHYKRCHWNKRDPDTSLVVLPFQPLPRRSPCYPYLNVKTAKFKVRKRISK